MIAGIRDKLRLAVALNDYGSEAALGDGFIVIACISRVNGKKSEVLCPYVDRTVAPIIGGTCAATPGVMC